MLEFLKKALGLGNDAQLKPLFKIADQIDALEPQMEKLSDEQLAAKTEEFKTRFKGGERQGAILYMVPPMEAETADESHKVAERRNGRMQPLPGRFDEVGSALLAEARKHPEGLIMMDECGHLEKDALRFRQEILRCLDGDIPVLGVLRRGQEWHREILNHPRVAVLNADGQDHEALAARIAEALGRKA